MIKQLIINEYNYKLSNKYIYKFFAVCYAVSIRIILLTLVIKAIIFISDLKSKYMNMKMLDQFKLNVIVLY